MWRGGLPSWMILVDAKGQPWNAVRLTSPKFGRGIEATRRMHIIQVEPARIGSVLAAAAWHAAEAVGG